MLKRIGNFELCFCDACGKLIKTFTVKNVVKFENFKGVLEYHVHEKCVNRLWVHVDTRTLPDPEEYD
jgi:hypothetical protein